MLSRAVDLACGPVKLFCMGILADQTAGFLSKAWEAAFTFSTVLA